MTGTLVQLIFTSLVVIAIASGLYISWQWPDATGLFPRAIGFPTAALGLAWLVTSVVEARRDGAKVQGSGVRFDRAYLVSAVPFFGWLVGFSVAIWVLGLPIAVPLFVFTYMRLAGKLGWLTALLWTLAAAASIWGAMWLAPHLNWPAGVLWKMVGL